MTTEEKAKAYDEVQEKIALRFGSNVAEEIFSEFETSEDEKVRKELLGYCKNKAEKYSNDPKYKNISAWIAWLENIPYTIDHEKREGFHLGYKACLEKQCEQKPWSEEDDDNMMMIEDRLSDYLDYIREDSTLTKHRKNSLKEEVIGYVNWLKSLKDRVQPKQEYSNTERQEMFIKSQRPHFWRPSKGQLECLDVAIDKVDKVHSPFFTNRAYLTLKALKKQLEQL